MEHSLAAFPIFSGDLVDRAIRSLSLRDNVHLVLPVGSEFFGSSTLRQVSDQDSVSSLQLMTICLFVVVYLSSSSLSGCCVTGDGINLSHSSLPVCHLVRVTFMLIADTQVEKEVDGELTRGGFRWLFVVWVYVSSHYLSLSCRVGPGVWSYWWSPSLQPVLVLPSALASYTCVRNTR